MGTLQVIKEYLSHRKCIEILEEGGRASGKLEEGDCWALPLELGISEIANYSS